MDDTGHSPPTVECSLCGAGNATDQTVCRACGGALPESPQQRNLGLHPAFEAILVSSPGRAGPPETPPTRGILRPVLKTAWNVAVRPEATFCNFRLAGGLAAPCAFTILMGAPSVFGYLVILKLRQNTAPSWYVAAILLALLPVAYAYLRAQVVHLLLVLTGRARESFEVTFRVVAYSNASLVPLVLIPLAGEFLFLAAGVWVESTGLSCSHRIPVPAAVLVEIVPALLLALSFAAAAFLGLLWWSQGQ